MLVDRYFELRVRSAYEVSENYQVTCTSSEALKQLTELRLRDPKIGYDPKSDYQIFTMSEILSRVTVNAGIDPNREMKIFGVLWENADALTNQTFSNLVIANTSEVRTEKWKYYSWLTALLNGNFDPQKHLEQASKLRLIDDNVDPYVLYEALIAWKENDSSP